MYSIDILSIFLKLFTSKQMNFFPQSQLLLLVHCQIKNHFKNDLSCVD